MDALRQHRQRQIDERLDWGPAYQDHGLVFSREDGTPIGQRTFSRSFDHHERLGHATIAITLDIYSHAIPAMQEDAAETIAALISVPDRGHLKELVRRQEREGSGGETFGVAYGSLRQYHVELGEEDHSQDHLKEHRARGHSAEERGRITCKYARAYLEELRRD